MARHLNYLDSDEQLSVSPWQPVWKTWHMILKKLICDYSYHFRKYLVGPVAYFQYLEIHIFKNICLFINAIFTLFDV